MKKLFKLLGKKKNINLQKINLSLIKFPKLNIHDILNFFNEISEFILLIPIYINYCNNNKNSKNYETQNDIIKKNYLVLFNIYDKIIIILIISFLKKLMNSQTYSLKLYQRLIL